MPMHTIEGGGAFCVLGLRGANTFEPFWLAGANNNRN